MTMCRPRHWIDSSPYPIVSSVLCLYTTNSYSYACCTTTHNFVSSRLQTSPWPHKIRLTHQPTTQEKAEAGKILQVKAQEAEAEAGLLSGLGIVQQRQPIIDGLRENTKTSSHAHLFMHLDTSSDLFAIVFGMSLSHIWMMLHNTQGTMEQKRELLHLDCCRGT
ncbi:hypothetical protein GOP47_0005659 [Adiantum capillus-veneris]|uniref:Uncharacterized protein n=1 Tax=Adiantum capillus-veneris TaxID=13818 RepID=A0A9D4V654_ADICA|nr:hypothetical protein GOP47_0005659 [Adiantum capillus-veneris]